MQSLDDLIDHLATTRPLPESTYRVQFHAGFTFRDAAAIVPYLADLGITHLYASPYLKAKPGSTHGYDVLDHCSLNPEVGSEQDYDAFVQALTAAGLSHILDTVPNHVGVGTNDNVWWNDVLAYGPASRYADYFDIAWRGSPWPELQEKLLLPVLGGPYGQVLDRGELQLEFDADTATLWIRYWDRRLPTAPVTYWYVCFFAAADRLKAIDPSAVDGWKSLLLDISRLAEIPNPKAPLLPQQRERRVQRRLRELCSSHPRVRDFLLERVREMNGRQGRAESFDSLDMTLGAQHYRLAYWRTAADEINYRQFFDINDLAGLRMERPEVFEAVHAFTLRLVAEGKVAGLRIDHPDGLYEPKGYFARLQMESARASLRAAGAADVSDAAATQLARARPLYVVAEKILAMGERLPDDWAVHGTSGYDFLNMVNGLFVNGGSEEALTRLYRDWTGDDPAYADLVYRKKKLILRISLAARLDFLAYVLDRLAQRDRRSRDFTLNGLRHALRETIACFPVYRTYTTEEGVRDEDRAYIEEAIAEAIGRNPKTDPSVFHFLRDVLLLKYPHTFSEEDRAEQRRFVSRFQQLAAPVTAKGVEDTAFYVYNRFVSLNEVGGDPGHFGVPPAALHAYLKERQAKWPYAMSALSTHDTKRSEDVRARLNVLSEMPEEWGAAVERWRALNEPHRRNAGGLSVPDANAEYLLYHTLIGAWPVGGLGDAERTTFVSRIQAYMQKAQREAKVHTSWTDPNADYEAAMRDFIARILGDHTGAAFLADFVPFQQRISHFGMLNSLSQTLLRLTAPGVPDTYQGTELWDFSLVDPDNRRPVDYAKRRGTLGELKSLPAYRERGPERSRLIDELLREKADGRIKLFVTWLALATRREHTGLFTTGEYLPADVTGPRREHIFSFARRHGDRAAIVAAPRFITGLAPADGLPLGRSVWTDTTIHLPAFAPGVTFRNVFTGERVTLAAGDDASATIAAADLFAHFPVALLISDE